MSVQFSVPLAFRDLLKSGGVGQYVVQEVQPVRQLPSQLSAYKVSLRSQGPQCVLQHFDALYSMLYHFRTIDASMKDLLELLVKATSQHAAELPAVLEDLSLSQAGKNTQLNTLKMKCLLSFGAGERSPCEGNGNRLLLQDDGKSEYRSSEEQAAVGGVIAPPGSGCKTLQ